MASTHLALLALAASVATPALAKDRNGLQAIATGDFRTAERRLTSERRIFPNRPELMLNLAFVYANTGREDEARVLYRQVLATDPVLLETPADAEANSHRIAATGLARIGEQPGRQIVAR